MKLLYHTPPEVSIHFYMRLKNQKLFADCPVVEREFFNLSVEDFHAKTRILVRPDSRNKKDLTI